MLKETFDVKNAISIETQPLTILAVDAPNLSKIGCYTEELVLCLAQRTSYIYQVGRKLNVPRILSGLLGGGDFRGTRPLIILLHLLLQPPGKTIPMMFHHPIFWRFSKLSLPQLEKAMLKRAGEMLDSLRAKGVKNILEAVSEISSWNLPVSEGGRDIILPFPGPTDTANPSTLQPFPGCQTGGGAEEPTTRGDSSRTPGTVVSEGEAAQTKDAKVSNEGGEASAVLSGDFSSGMQSAADAADSVGKAMREAEIRDDWENAHKEEMELLRDQAEEEEQGEKAGGDEGQDGVMVDDDEAPNKVFGNRVLSLPDRGVLVMNAYALKNGAYIIVARGSIIDYSGDAAVNSTTPEGDGCEAPEGYVDKAFQDKGGHGMARARRELPILQGKLVRIPEGKAMTTHPLIVLTVSPCARDWPQLRREARPIAR